MGPAFSRGQHDASDFLEQFLERARQEEVARQMYGLWGGVQQGYAVATQVDRLFGFVQETRRQCASCQGTVRSWYANERILRVSPESADGGPLTTSELYFASCAKQESFVDCPQCQREAEHRTQVRMMTAPNVLAMHVRRRPGARVPVAVEQQLDLPGFPLMELVGVVYHNGVDFHSGHYTCLCRGPGGRFWFYDDNLPVQRVDQEIAHIKPKEVLLAVYARSDGGAALAQVAEEAAEPVAVRVDEAVAVLEPQAGPMSVSAQSPRRLRRKTSCDVALAGTEVAGLSEGGAAATPRGVPATGSVMSPASRRLSRKTSATDAAMCGQSSAGSPVASGKKQRIGEAGEASPSAMVRSPCSRRLRRKVSAEEAAVGVGHATVLSSPGSRRLRRKASADEAVPSGNMRPGVGSLSVLAEEAREDGLVGVGGHGSAQSSAACGRRESLARRSSTADIGAALQGRGASTLRRGRGRGRHTGSRESVLDAGGRRQEAAAEWFLSAAEMGGSVGAAHEPRGSEDIGSAPSRRCGVVSGFGAERTEDALGDQEQRDREAISRARERRETGVRGRARDFQGNELDRSAGGAWAFGRR